MTRRWWVMDVFVFLPFYTVETMWSGFRAAGRMGMRNMGQVLGWLRKIPNRMRADGRIGL